MSIQNHRAPRTARRQIFLVTTAFAAATLFVVLGGNKGRAEDPVSEVRFACKEDKTIDATFYADKVDLTLSDGRSMSLPQTMSGSGIRYANADENFVFWSKGDTAFVTEGADEKETFSDCFVAK